MIYFDKEKPEEVPVIPAEVATCPICGAPAVIEDIDEWEVETGRVTDVGFHVNCSIEPDDDDDDAEDWFSTHWSMPYVDWLPVQKKVYKWFDRRYRLRSA